MPAFYAKPQTLDDLVDFTVGRVLDLFAIPTVPIRRWGEDADLKRRPEVGETAFLDGTGQGATARALVGWSRLLPDGETQLCETMTAPVFPPSKSPELRRSPEANSYAAPNIAFGGYWQFPDKLVRRGGSKPVL